MEQTKTAGTVTGAPQKILRFEGLLIATLAMVAYHRLGGGWTLFAALVLLPDLSFLAYLGGPAIGAAGYNIAHSLMGPALLGAAVVFNAALAPYALIWAAHIGFDRALGYGLKHSSGFRATHLGIVGKDKAPDAAAATS